MVTLKEYKLYVYLYTDDIIGLYKDITLLESIADKLYEAGCNDALVCLDKEGIHLDFNRIALTQQKAIESIITNIRHAGYSIRYILT